MRTILAMPRYGGAVHMAAAHAFYNPVAPGSRVKVRLLSQATSLLTASFNSAWAGARNEWEAGNADAFAMIHTDVAPQDGWLDVLAAELDASGADVIGVTMPIKDLRGLHSTAVETGDHWRVRRLSSAEIARLPETFTDADVPGLLLNTGLWLAKLGPWCLDVLFHIEDTIQRGPDGKWRAGTMPEDWGFSRQCRKLGLKLAATRKVQADHYGDHKWDNQAVWGWSHDLQNTPSLAEWLWPADVEGWLTEAEGRELALLAAGKVVLEIGSYCGLSTICMAQTADRVYAVDPFDGRACLTDLRPTRDEFSENVRRYGVGHRVTVCLGTSDVEVRKLGIDFADLAFIDGAHDYASVRADAELATCTLKRGGLLAFHDYRRPRDPGVTAAVDDLIRGGARLVRVTDTLAVVEPAACGV
jgi:predicted O-methyltransferase YrrM